MDDDRTEQPRREGETTSGQYRATAESGHEERRSDERQSTTTSTGFVWCESVASEPSDGGFEWGGAVDESEEATEEESRRKPDPEHSDETEENDGLTLDPTLVTTTRGAGIDDEAVSLLAAFRDHLRRDRDRGR